MGMSCYFILVNDVCVEIKLMFEKQSDNNHYDLKAMENSQRTTIMILIYAFTHLTDTYRPI